jgi:hypothetical protein
MRNRSFRLSLKSRVGPGHLEETRRVAAYELLWFTPQATLCRRSAALNDHSSHADLGRESATEAGRAIPLGETIRCPTCEKPARPYCLVPKRCPRMTCSTSSSPYCWARGADRISRR